MIYPEISQLRLVISRWVSMQLSPT